MNEPTGKLTARSVEKIFDSKHKRTVALRLSTWRYSKARLLV